MSVRRKERNCANEKRKEDAIMAIMRIGAVGERRFGKV
jgi:hypothetical protein